MSELSNYLENKLLNHFLRVSAYTQPTALYLALYTNAPTDSTAGTEISGGGYARQLVTFNTATTGASSNSGILEFSNTSWSGTIVAVGLLDALTSGNLLMFTTIVPSLAVASGESVTAAPGAIVVTLD